MVVVNFLSSGALRDIKTMDELFDIRPQNGDDFWQLE